MFVEVSLYKNGGSAKVAIVRQWRKMNNMIASVIEKAAPIIDCIRNCKICSE